MQKLVLLLGLLVAASAWAAPGPQSYTSYPPGTLDGNPAMTADAAVPHSQAYANIGHLATLKAASLTVTTDQPLVMFTWAMPAIYQITSVYMTNCTTTPAGATGGIYTASSKGGAQIVAATQTYTALTTTTAIQALTNNVATTAQSATQLYFALTAGASAGTPNCDVYVDGIGMQ